MLFRSLHVLGFAVALVWAQLAWSQTGDQVGEKEGHELEAAVEFVQETGVNGNLRVIAFQVTQITQTMAILAAEHGLAVVPVLRKNLNIAAAKRQAEWDRNLARAYLKFLTTEELSSLQKDGRNSPYFQKFAGHQNDIGDEMKSNSENIVGEVASEALVLSVEEMGLGER